MASHRTILILFTVLSAFIMSSKGSTTGASSTVVPETTATSFMSTTTTTETLDTGTVTTTESPTAPSTSMPAITTVTPDMKGFDDLETVDYIIIGVTCGVCAGIIIGAIVIIARKRMRKDKEDASSLVNHGHHPEYITELGGGVTNYKIEH